MGLLSDVI